jgi:hypothetical protein
LVRKLHVNTVLQLVLGQSIKILAANGWVEEVGGGGERKKRIPLALKERESHQPCEISGGWPLAVSPTGPGVLY